MTSHKPIDYKNAISGDQWKVWVPFHFLPGNEPKTGNFVTRMVCRKNSEPARKMTADALSTGNKPYWPHLIGVTAHVYADTFSHFGFVGFSNEWNKVDNEAIKASKEHSSGIRSYIRMKFEDFKTRFAGGFAETVPVGHGAVGTYPDRPYLTWSFKYEQGRHKKVDTDRDNAANFLEGCQALHGFFSNFAKKSTTHRDPEGPRPWDSISPDVRRILREEAPGKDRIRLWKECVSSGNLCHVTPTDKNIDYDEGLWRPRRAEYELGKKKDITRTHACQFIRAAWRHRDYVLHELLPSMGLIVY